MRTDMKIAIVLAAAVQMTWLGCDGTPPADPCASQLVSGELLTNVTARTATVSWVAARDTEFRVRYAPAESGAGAGAMMLADRAREVLGRIEQGTRGTCRTDSPEHPPARSP